MSHGHDLSAMLTGRHSDGDVVLNRSDNPTFEGVLEQRYSRRLTVFGGMTATAAAMFGLAAYDGGGGDIDDKLRNAVVTAGAAQTISAGGVVTLTGTRPQPWSRVTG